MWSQLVTDPLNQTEIVRINYCKGTFLFILLRLSMIN